MSQTRFDQLIDAFHLRVQLAISLFDMHRGLRDMVDWRSAGLPRTGFISSDGKYAYAFHGIGCWAETPEGEIDWDFGPDGEQDGVDVWRLWCFAEASSPIFDEYLDKAYLESHFESAVREGALKPRARSNLFFRDTYSQAETS